METRQQEDTMKDWKRQLKFTDHHVVNPIRTGGGLALFWGDSVQVTILDSTPNYVDTAVCFISDAFVCKITWIYGNPHENEKKAFWRLMYQRFVTQTQPWLVIGDFNEVLESSEKWGGDIPSLWRINLFRDFLSGRQLRDLHFQGPDFTWFAMRYGRVYIKERLDRALGNLAWCSTQSHTQLFHLPIVGSDHRPILLDTHPRETRRKCLFRFEQMWIPHEEYKDLIHQSWKHDPANTAMQNWISNLSRCGIALKAWSKEKFVNPNIQVNELLVDLEKLHHSSQPDVLQQINCLTSKITKLWTQDEMYWHQRSRINWLKLGDQNTNFFHHSTLQRRQFNKILRIQDTNGAWLETDKDISNHFSEYFSDLYTSNGPQEWEEVLDFVDTLVTSEMNDKLTAEVTIQEVKEAVFDLGATKAPGPDGFSGIFYQDQWELVRSIIHESAIQHHSTNSLLQVLNQTHLALIPKVKAPVSATQYRPIALCNFSYKILTKILVNRLKPYMPNLISENQSAFVSNRQIQDNIIVAHEIFHHLKLRRVGHNGAFGLKLDMNKAYDRVEWNFLEAVLRKMGFSNRWVTLVMSCVTTSTLSVLINGKPGPFFNPSRGLRQGDPLSPFLFLFVNDVLSKMIIKSCQSAMLSPVTIGPQNLGVSHLFFADDSLFFLQATLQNCEMLSDLLHTFCVASGQLINVDKSSIYFSPNTPVEVVHLLSAIMQIPAVFDPGKYLGLPTIWHRSKKAALGFIKESIIKKVKGWKQATLSQAGKEVLIKAIATAIPAYPMSCFKFPVSLCSEINGILADFWWGKMESNGLHWKSWNFLSLSKTEGGMGFRNLEEFNNSLLAKQAWNLIHNPSSLWASILKQQYYPNSTFLQAKKGAASSWVWASLLAGREIIQQGSLWSIGNGISTNMSRTNWIPTHPPSAIVLPPAFDNSTVSNLIDWDNKTWNLQQLSPHITQDQGLLISAIPITDPSIPDSLIWPYSKNGSFTVKSGYHFQHLQSQAGTLQHPHNSHNIPSAIWKWIWSLHSLPRIKHFLWRATLGILPSKATLFRRHIASSAECQICLHHSETTEHALLECPWAVSAWFAHPLSYRVPLQEITSFDSWLHFVSQLKAPMDFIIQISFLLWRIWKHRCDCFFNKAHPDPVRVAMSSFQAANEFIEANSIVFPNPDPPSLGRAIHQHLSWIPPPPNVIRINTDASWHQQTLSSGIAAVARDMHGFLINGKALKMLAPSPLTAEALAIREAVYLALEYPSHEIIITSDAKNLIDSLQSNAPISDWKAATVISQVRYLSSTRHFS